MIWKISDRTLQLDRTLLMGILNVTPDSFSDSHGHKSPKEFAQEATALAEAGADILDIGAESTRPNATPVGEDEELSRLMPVLDLLRDRIQVPISVDTTKPNVARACLQKGVQIINDVSGLKQSGLEMAELVRDFKAGLVIMHRRGNPQTMQKMTQYGNVIEDLMGELREQMAFAEEAGIHSSQIVLDPGLGFAKTAEQSLEIVRRLEDFNPLGRPILLGPSRKSFLGALTGREAGQRDYATAAVCAFAIQKGVSILRVHHIPAMVDVARITESIRGEQYVGTF